MHPTPRQLLFTIAMGVLVLGLLVMGLRSKRASQGEAPPPVAPASTARFAPYLLRQVRVEPETFPRDTYLPNMREGHVSGSVDLDSFSPGRELVRVDDPRIWWESDHDKGDTEDDHTMHRNVELPLRRVLELVADRGGTLEVHDAYRPSGLHNARSLHLEGRAIDLTCDQMSLEALAKLCWAAGFDWVYHEAKAKLGAHVHCSVKR